MTKLQIPSHLRNSKPFKSATFCSGIGSPEQSLKELNANHINVFACEKDKFARQTYLANFTPGIMLEDMTTESYDDPELYADLVVAGIPCQSFSLAGKRKGENDPRGLLIYDFIRYVKKRRPKVFIIENVKGLLSDAGGVTFGKWLELLGRSRNGQDNMFNHSDTLGYNLHYRVLNAKHYGLPQNRERVFIIGIRPDLPEDYKWPKRVVLKDRLIDLLESEVDEKYYLSDNFLQYIKDNPNRTRVIDSCETICPAILANQAKTGTDSVLLKVGQLPGYEASNRVYSEQVLAPNIRTKQQGIIHTKDRLRRFTPLELMRLQGYPDSYNKPCSTFQTSKQVGNSIPVHMMKAVLKPLLPLLEHPQPQIISRPQ